MGRQLLNGECSGSMQEENRHIQGTHMIQVANTHLHALVRRPNKFKDHHSSQLFKLNAASTLPFYLCQFVVHDMGQSSGKLLL